MTHAELVAAAASWLKHGHHIVMTEITTSGEEPDAIGWGSANATTLIECKATRSDFLSDRKKPYRKNPELGLGQYRYYMTPEGLVALNELPVGWGLIEVYPEKRWSMRVVRKPMPMASNLRAEIRLLASCVRRIGSHVPDGIGISVKCYVIQTNCRATLGVLPEGDAE